MLMLLLNSIPLLVKRFWRMRIFPVTHRLLQRLARPGRVTPTMILTSMFLTNHMRTLLQLNHTLLTLSLKRLVILYLSVPPFNQRTPFGAALTAIRPKGSQFLSQQSIGPGATNVVVEFSTNWWSRTRSEGQSSWRDDDVRRNLNQF